MKTKHILIGVIILVVATITATCLNVLPRENTTAACLNTLPRENTTSPRDYTYEQYCDSIWENDPAYYQDVLCTTDEYCDYIDEHGEWWDN